MAGEQATRTVTRARALERVKTSSRVQGSDLKPVNASAHSGRLTAALVPLEEQKPQIPVSLANTPCSSSR